MNAPLPTSLTASCDSAPAAVPPTLREQAVVRVRSGMQAKAMDAVVEEVPVALVYNGVSHAVMMATPADLEAFAVGFSLSEGILAHPRECFGIDVEAGTEGISVHLEVATPAFLSLKERRRTLAGRTGCGLCGVDSLQAARRPLRVVGAPMLAADAVRRALADIGAAQPLARATGAAHAAAWCGLDGSLRIVREDVGRHNALDKTIGAMAHDGAEPQDGFMLITSRVSLEMVQKAMTVGVGAIVGMSAPTLAAVELAEAAGMLLLAFARGDGFVCYAHPEHLIRRPREGGDPF
jgi:FdhD protein